MVKKEKTETLVEPGEITVTVDWSAQPSRAPSLWLIGAVVCALTALVVVLSGCAGTTVQSGPVPGGAIPVGCYAAALQAADEAALKRCGGVWSICEHRASILAELDRQLEACDVVSSER
jgi:hypothetical protein